MLRTTFSSGTFVSIVRSERAVTSSICSFACCGTTDLMIAGNTMIRIAPAITISRARIWREEEDLRNS